MRDLYNNLDPALAVAPAVYTADSTPTSIDLKGSRSALMDIAVGVGGITFSGTNKIEFVMEHCDDDSAWSAVALSDVQGPASVTSGIVHSLVAAHAAASLTKVGYIGHKRYIRLTADFSGTHGAGTPISASVMRGHLLERPAA